MQTNIYIYGINIHRYIHIHKERSFLHKIEFNM